MRPVLVTLLAAVALTAGCSSDDAAEPAATTTTLVAATTAAPTTIDDGPDAAPVEDICGVLDEALRDTGLIVEGAPEQRLTATPDGCEWGLIALAVRSDVDSAAFEDAVATLPGDPMTVDGLGEMAVSGDSLVVAYEGGHLVTVTGHDVMGEDQLVPLVRAVFVLLQ